MPLYEYICRECSFEFEELQKFSDRPIKKCPECNKSKVVKKISLSAFALKGEGWYKDGYSRPSEKSKPETKASDPTPAAKPEKKPDKATSTAA